MGKQINIGHGNHSASPENSSGYGFNASGQPTVTNDQGQDVIIQTGDNSPANIITNKGIGLEEDIPSVGINVGDIYVSNDSFKVFTAVDSITWGEVSLVNGQFITDVLDTEELPPLYQFYNDNLMPVANYVTNELGDLPE